MNHAKSNVVVDSVERCTDASTKNKDFAPSHVDQDGTLIAEFVTLGKSLNLESDLVKKFPAMNAKNLSTS